MRDLKHPKARALGSTTHINTFFISDTHFGHTNIIKYCDRPFSSVGEMNKTLIYNWNKVVKDIDIVYFLGDFCFGDPNDYLPYLNGIIIPFKGNHDKRKDWNVSLLDSGYCVRGGHIFYLTHDPEHIPKSWEGWSITGHTHNKGDFINFEDKIINVSVEHIEYTPINIELIIQMLYGHF